MAPQAVEGSANGAETDDVAAAEAQAAVAEERARQARAHAADLRRQAAGTAPTAPLLAAVAASRRSVRWQPIAAGLAALAVCASLGTGSALTWSLHVAQTHRHQQERAAAVARQGVIDIMSLNFVNAEEDMQRIMDNTTGNFKQQFQGQQYMLVKELIESKVVTHIDVTGVAVQSASDDSAVVLVATTSQAANVKDPHPAPKRFRVVVTLAKDQDRLKISQLAYVEPHR
jgi:Mce-associated membrane protein